jgi:ferredoxin, 2Fe-2S
MYTVTFHFEEQELVPVTLFDVESGQSLLEVALLHGIHLHHNCGGVCSCGTCQLYISKGEGALEEMSKKEAHFLARAIDRKQNSRLACQCLLLDGKGEIEVMLPDQTKVPDE